MIKSICSKCNKPSEIQELVTLCKKNGKAKIITNTKCKLCNNLINDLNKEFSFTDNEHAISYLISEFIHKNDSFTIKAFFQEIFEQKGIGKGKRHKRDVLDHSRQTIESYLSAKFLSGSIHDYMDQTIDDLSRHKLLLIAMAFHDAGKMLQKKETGSMKGHGEFTLKNQIQTITKRFGLTKRQTQHITNIIKYHHVLLEKEPIKEILLKLQNCYVEHLLIHYCDNDASRGSQISENDIEKIQKFVEHKLNEFRIEIKKNKSLSDYLIELSKSLGLEENNSLKKIRKEIVGNSKIGKFNISSLSRYDHFAVKLIDKFEGIDFQKKQIAIILLKAAINYDCQNNELYKQNIKDAYIYADYIKLDEIKEIIGILL